MIINPYWVIFLAMWEMNPFLRPWMPLGGPPQER